MIIDTLTLVDVKSKDKKIYYDYYKNLPISGISKQIMFQCDRFQIKVEEYENRNLNGNLLNLGFMRCFPLY